MLSCSCGEWEGEGWYYINPSDFTKLSTTRRKRCCSCQELININADCLEFDRYRAPKDEIEIKIFGEDEEIEIATWYMCEGCGEIFLNLEDLGYCLSIETPMQEYLAEYQEMTGFKKATEQLTIGDEVHDVRK